MGVDEAVDGLRTRAAAYAVGAYEFFENIRLNAAYTLFGPPSPEDLYTGSANPFSAKTVLITGANQGIGLATARALYRRGGKVVLACRSLERGSEAVEVRSGAVHTVRVRVLQRGRQCADGRVRACAAECVIFLWGNWQPRAPMPLRQQQRRPCRLTRACRACQALEGAAPLPGCTAGTAEAIRLDLSSLASVRECVAAYSKRRAPLDLLVCNAGVMAPPRRMQVGARPALLFAAPALAPLDAVCRLARAARSPGR